VIRIEDGPEIVLPVSLLARQHDGMVRLPFDFDALARSNSRQENVIPVWHEELQISKHVVDTGKGVRVHKTVSEREQIVDQPLLHDELTIEHVPIGQMIADGQPPAMHYDGDTLVVPILEEVLVVQKQLRLKEEVRITKRRREMHAPQTILLKSEQVSVERFDEQSESSRGDRNSIRQPSTRVEPGPGKAAG
jgi:uncharacterized protein (TIGR02271 family)